MMSSKIILYSGLVVGGFLLGYFKASTSIDKEARAKVLKEKDMQDLYYQIESLRNNSKALVEGFSEMTTQSARDELKAIKKRTEVQSALIGIADGLNSYSHEELKVKLIFLASELSE